MGWAKYYEDDMSIYIGRMAVKDSVPLYRAQPCGVKRVLEKAPVPVVKSQYEKVDRPKNRNGRRGLELTFVHEPEKILVKLQMNGWWWSSGNNCWCNQDTVGNRKYAQGMISIAGAHLAIVNA